MADAYFKKALERLIADFKSGDHILNDETLESIDELIKINELGLLTDDSQQGCVEYDKMPIDRKLYAQIFHDVVKNRIPQEHFTSTIDSMYEQCGGKWKDEKDIIEKERAYLCGFIENNKADLLVNMLNQQDNIIAWYNIYDQDANGCSIPVTYIVAHQDNKFSPFDSSPLYPFSRLGRWNEGVSESIYGEKVGFPEKYDDEYSCMMIIDARYGHHVREKDGLFKRVIKALEVLNNV